MGKSTISMAMFNSYFDITILGNPTFHHKNMAAKWSRPGPTNLPVRAVDKHVL